MKRLSLLTIVALVVQVGISNAQIIPETEANDTKAQANAAVFTAGGGNGGSITGTTTGTTVTGTGVIGSADTFLVSINAGLAPGIYRHRLVLTSQTVGHTGTIRGLSQTAGEPNAGTDIAVQTSSIATTPARFNQFYGFGNPNAQLYYRVTGGTATTDPYQATIETIQVTPTDIGFFNPGSITITTVGQGHSTDTDMWVYDSSFNAIPDFGNDDEPSPGTTFQSRLTRTYAPGTYYLALTNFQFANHLGSPVDDRFRSGLVMDFPGFAVNSSTTANLNMAFNINDGTTSLNVANTKVGAYDINWFCFTVVPEPSALLLSLLGMTFIARRRK
jgi:hypothetical protein